MRPMPVSLDAAESAPPSRPHYTHGAGPPPFMAWYGFRTSLTEGRCILNRM